MTANDIHNFRQRLSEDPDNLLNRRTLHEHYEWLESYWNDNYKGKNQIDKFASDYGAFFWNLEETKAIARKFSFYPPVGSSKRNFNPTETVKRATFFIKYNTGLFGDKFPDIDNEKVIGDKWNKSPFVALLTIVKQIRDNLFHGRKMELADDQYNRNKELVAMATEVTSIILDNLQAAENHADMA